MRGVRRIGGPVAILAVAFTLLATTAATAAPGDLDTSFSNDGRLRNGLLDRAVAVQPDGKILVSGLNPRTGRFTVFRYTAGGALDGSFTETGGRRFRSRAS